MSVVNKAMYKPLSLVSGALGGMLAGAIFNRLWRSLAHEDEPPGPAALDRGTREVLLAAVLQGAVFGLVKAAIDRAAAQSYRRFTGEDPGA